MLSISSSTTRMTGRPRPSILVQYYMGGESTLPQRIGKIPVPRRLREKAYHSRAECLPYQGCAAGDGGRGESRVSDVWRRPDLELAGWPSAPPRRRGQEGRP